MKPSISYLYLATLILLSACSSPTLTTAPNVTTPTSLPIHIQTPPPQPPPASSATPTAFPNPTPSATISVTYYNRYIGKDSTRQPDLIKTPPVSVISVRSAEGYARSYIAVFLNGTQVNGDEIRGDPEMLAQLIRLFNDAFKAQHTAQTVLSSYRSYEEQVYLRQTNPEEIDSFLAAPGRSEHHLGTSLDLAWQTERMTFYVMNVYPRARAFYNWLKENVQNYGFIFSYPYKTTPDQKKDNLLAPYLTEYKAEPWHIRYVGVELAQKIFAARDEQNRGYLDPLSTLIPQMFMLP